MSASAETPKELGSEPAMAFTLGVLAGGFSRRFGRDKADVLFGGERLVDRCLRRMGAEVRNHIVATRVGGPAAIGPYEVVFDEDPGAGPLAASLSVLRWAKTEWSLIVPCDQPFLPEDLGFAMRALAEGADAVLLSVGEALEPLPALLSRRLILPLESALARGQRRMDSWHSEAKIRALDFRACYPDLDPIHCLANLNTAADFELAARAPDSRAPGSSA